MFSGPWGEISRSRWKLRCLRKRYALSNLPDLPRVAKSERFGALSSAQLKNWPRRVLWKRLNGIRAFLGLFRHRPESPRLLLPNSCCVSWTSVGGIGSTSSPMASRLPVRCRGNRCARSVRCGASVFLPTRFLPRPRHVSGGELQNPA